MVQGIAYGILHVYNALIDDPVTCRHRSRTGALLLLRQALWLSSASAEAAQRDGIHMAAHKAFTWSPSLTGFRAKAASMDVVCSGLCSRTSADDTGTGRQGSNVHVVMPGSVTSMRTASYCSSREIVLTSGLLGTYRPQSWALPSRYKMLKLPAMPAVASPAGFVSPV
jgi:hypothetical protein